MLSLHSNTLTSIWDNLYGKNLLVAISPFRKTKSEQVKEYLYCRVVKQFTATPLDEFKQIDVTNPYDKPNHQVIRQACNNYFLRLYLTREDPVFVYCLLTSLARDVGRATDANIVLPIGSLGYEMWETLMQNPNLSIDQILNLACTQFEVFS